MSDDVRVTIVCKNNKTYKKVLVSYAYQGKEFGKYENFVAFYPNDDYNAVRVIPMNNIDYIDVHGKGWQ